MEDFAAAGFEGDILAELYLCCQTLRPTRLYDIYTCNGKAISANAWKGKNNREIDR